MSTTATTLIHLPTPGLLAAALQYAAARIPVMPLHTPHPTSGCSCRDGLECGSPGKHPRLKHGLLDASTDSKLIHAWWRRWPDANVGLATGTVLDVCDVDTADGMRRVLDILDVVRPAAPLVRTGLGWHIWYASSGLPSRVGMLPGVDWRGQGGSAVAPPSLHTLGTRYAFQQPWTTAPALPGCPPALRGIVIPPAPPVVAGAGGGITHLDRYTTAALHSEITRIRDAPRPVVHGGRRVVAGGRNNALHLAAFRLGQLAARSDLDEQTVCSQLTDAALDVGLSQGEARRTIRSGWRAGLRRPRRYCKPSSLPTRFRIAPRHRNPTEAAPADPAGAAHRNVCEEVLYSPLSRRSWNPTPTRCRSPRSRLSGSTVCTASAATPATTSSGSAV